MTELEQRLAKTVERLYVPSADGRDMTVRTSASLTVSEKPPATSAEETRDTALPTAASPAGAPQPRAGFKTWATSINPGLPMMALNSLTACFISLTVKSLTSPPYSYGTMQLVFVRSLILSSMGLAWTCGWPFVKYYYKSTIQGKSNVLRPVIKDSFADLLFGPRNARLLMFARSFCGFVTVSGTYLALIGLNVGEATVLTFIKSIWVGILETGCNLLLISLLGVGIIASPSSFGLGVKLAGPGLVKSVTPLGRILSLAAGIVSSFSAAAVYRALFHWSHVMDGQFNWLAAFRRFPTSWWEFTLLVPLMSVMSLANQLLMNLALRYETAAKCAAMGFTQAPFGYISDWIAYGEVPGMPDYIGGGTIVGCVLLMTLQKLKKEMDAARHLAALKISAAAHLAAHKVVDLGSHMHLHIHMPHFHHHHDEHAGGEHSHATSSHTNMTADTGGAPPQIKLPTEASPGAPLFRKEPSTSPEPWFQAWSPARRSSVHVWITRRIARRAGKSPDSPRSCSSSDDETVADDQPLMMRPLVPKGGQRSGVV
ncbi:hypothetical protein BCR44DRAFT_1516367 [Catenaria anguillulae PL171]|uniref:EamA domain-containing protein n=1 Tax=Catenaria anguillulae PL171 TaxID=765915 RepID=A0A1Y2H9F2_9FUNG|nr:hypothetical protein BCR44DRAFT_1516367 [Catenaria anguillulae PL171]